MVPRAPMLATKNRTGIVSGLILALAVLLTACAPPGPRALLKGKKLLDAGNYDEALQELKTATENMPTNAVAWNYRGLAYHRAGQVTNAAAAYNRALLLNRDLLEARFNLGCLRLEQNELDAAKSDFTAYTIRRGNAPEGWLKLGLAQLQAHDTAAAEKSFRTAARLNPKSAEALNGLGLAQLQHGQAAEATQSFSAALQQQPDYRPALLNLATVLHRDLNHRPEALRRYREYLALQPRAEDWEAVNALAQTLTPPSALPPTVTQPRPATNIATRTATVTNAAKPAPAIANRPVPPPKPATNPVAAKPAPAPAAVAAPPPAPTEVVKLPPESLVKTAEDHSRTNVVPTPAVAVATNAAATTGAKTESPGIISRLNPFKRETKPGGGGTNGTSPARLNPTPADGRYAYQTPAAPPAGDRRSAEQALDAGQKAQSAGRLAEAIQSYRRAGQLDGSYFEAHYRLGLVAFEARSFRLGLTAWETALALQPDSADARYNFALTLKAANYPKDAAAELEKLLAVHPDEARGHLILGNLYAEQLRDLPRARQHYGRVLQLDPRNPQAQAIRYWLVANPG